ncbi:MAG: MotA/TolQ/ExbB proton channel family protein [Bacteroidales bacterium]|nr:MotA/TolQ/ExbB proton channel family protein [Bacteroidales bacterium]MDD3907129.1 MotA/TolQ/ExbB proton channel family protein [Bacteroidales bacterium]MDD4712095.1 MotA/TolQ/ExbB proton channel family protein [Bacteroidales bacterium]
METKKQKKVKKTRSVSAALVIFGCAIVAVCFFVFVCGDPSGFNEKGAPLQGNIFATMYKGGFVVPIILTLLLTVLTLSVERAFAFRRMKGKANQTKFVMNVKAKLAEGDIAGAREMCDKQKGTVANILNAGLIRYEDVEKIQGMNNDEKAAIIQKELEEATALEMPSMQQNLPVIAVISTLGTLFGLLGTVLGMIRAFAALGQEGSPDSLALSTAISEALINTASGIATGAMAIIFYNYFAQKVENITNAVDEVGFAVGQTYTTKHLGK